MTPPRVLNRHRDTIPPEAVYVGRGTAFGNPYTHRRGSHSAPYLVATRDAAIQAFATALFAQPTLLLHVREALRGRDLVCSCTPAPCHADILLRVANGFAVAIVGSREFPHLDWVEHGVSDMAPGTLMVSGNARGVDRTAEKAARRRGDLLVVSLPADWNGPHGKLAGFARNADIVRFADRVVAYWDGKSRGTKHTIDIATQQGKPVLVVQPDGSEHLLNCGGFV